MEGFNNNLKKLDLNDNLYKKVTSKNLHDIIINYYNIIYNREIKIPKE